MTVKCEFMCDGCGVTASGSASLDRQRWNETLSESVQRTAPDGWVAFDPFTRVSYCPACWLYVCSDNRSDDGKEAQP